MEINVKNFLFEYGNRPENINILGAGEKKSKEEFDESVAEDPEFFEMFSNMLEEFAEIRIKEYKVEMAKSDIPEINR